MAGVWTTTDIALAAYVSLCGEASGIKLQKVERNGASSVFVFKDERGYIDELLVCWPTSECFRFDARIRALKSLGYSRDQHSVEVTNARR